MKGDLNLSKLYKELEVIFQSPLFMNSAKEIKLLNYLIQKTIAGEFIKEAHIATEVFDKEDNFDPSLDSTVRVYIGKLRKKLQTFYLSEESNGCTIRITIPKGQHTVVFGKLHKRNILGKFKRISTIFILFSIVLSIAFSAHLINDNNDLFSNSNSVSRSPVWKEYSKSDLPTLIVTGDFFFMTKRLDDKRYIVRNSQINSKEEFEQNQMDTLGFNDFRHTYTPSDMSECVINFIFYLINNKEVYKVKQASKLTWEDINTNNLIFIGEFKTLYILNRLLPRFNISYDLNEKAYFLLDDDKRQIKKFEFNREPDGYQDQHIVVLKRPGGNDNTITLIITLHRGGIKEITNKLVDNDFLGDFTNLYYKNRKMSFFFDAVFKIEKMEGTTLNFSVEYFNQIQL